MHWSFDLSPGSTSPLALLLHADIVVQIIMGGLLIASIWTWAIIIGFSTKVGATRRKIDKFEKDFWKAEDIDAFYKLHGDDELPVARVFAAGVSEWRRSTAGGVVDREGIRERLATAMGSAVAGRRTSSPTGSTSWRPSGRLRRSSGCSEPSGESCRASPASPRPRIPASR
jgi:biopolymer transport protein TolQ